MKSFTRKALASQPQSDRSPSAVGAFLAGLPERRGRVVTASSVIDNHLGKHPAIVRRLQQERLGRAWRAA